MTSALRCSTIMNVAKLLEGDPAHRAAGRGSAEMRPSSGNLLSLINDILNDTLLVSAGKAADQQPCSTSCSSSSTRNFATGAVGNTSNSASAQTTTCPTCSTATRSDRAGPRPTSRRRAEVHRPRSVRVNCYMRAV